MPTIKFFYDESFDYGSKIDSLLKTIETKDEKGN
jgi:ribosome-binding factor A